MRKWGFIALLALVAFGASGCGWLQLGGNAARTSFNKDETKLTADKLPKLDFVWFDHEITHANAPVVNDGIVYVTSGNVVTAKSAGSGANLWQKTITNAAGVPELSEPSIYKERLMATYTVRNASYFVVAGGVLDFDLKTGGFNDIPMVNTEPRGFVVSGQTFAMSAVVTSGSRYAAVLTYGDPANPTSAVMAVDTPGPVSRPMMLGNQIFVSHAGTVYAFRMGTCPPSPVLPGFCGPEWTVALGTGANEIAGMPVGVGTDAIAVPVDIGRTHVISTSGEVLWSTADATSDRGIAVANGVIYTAGHDGFVRAYSAVEGDCPGDDCHPLWKAQVGGMLTAPVVAAGVVYVGATDGEMRAYTASGCGAPDCGAIWSISTGGDRIWPIVWDGRIYVTSDNGVSAIKEF